MPESLDILLQRVTTQQQIAKVRLLLGETLRRLLDDFLICFAHDATVLKENTITLHETQSVLEQGITIAGNDSGT